MNFVQLREQVRTEARVNTPELTSWIDSLINEIYIDKVRGKQFPEMFVTDHVLEIDEDKQSKFPVPVDLDQLVSVEFATDVDRTWRPLTKINPHTLRSSSGYPRWFFRAGVEIHIFPFSELRHQGHNYLRLSYFRLPSPLVSPGDKIEVPRLESVVLKEAVARVIRYHNQNSTANEYIADASRYHAQ